MDQLKKTKLLLLIAALVAAVLGAVLLVVGFGYDGSTVGKVLLIAIAVLVFALAGELVYLSFLCSESAKPNYFLYNTQTGRNISLQKLDFKTINARMNRYLSSYAASEGKIWTERVLDNPYLEMSEIYRPLVAYKLLFDLAERDVEAGWKCFEYASDETIEFLAAAVESNGDNQMAENLRSFKLSKPMNLKVVRDYFVTNRKYLQSKIYNYVVANIDGFVIMK